MVWFEEKDFDLFHKGFLFRFDLRITKFRNTFNFHVFDILCRFFSVLDKKYFFLFVIYFPVYFLTENLMFFVYSVIGIILSDQTCLWVFKRNIRRYRPLRQIAMLSSSDKSLGSLSKILNKFYYVVSSVANSSMCSSHAANFLTLGLLYNYYVPYIGWIVLVLFAFVGFSRWYIGVHWASDILVGWAVGFFVFQLLTGIIFA